MPKWDSPYCLQYCLVPVKVAQPWGALGGLCPLLGVLPPHHTQARAAPWLHRYSSTYPPEHSRQH